MSPKNPAPARAATSPRAPRVPRLRVHRPTGQACIYLDGERLYVGAAGAPETEGRYRRLVADLLANGGRLPPPAPDDLTVAELLVRFLEHAEGYYASPDRGHGDEMANLKAALRPLSALYADLPAASFGPREFRAYRDMLTRGEGMRRPASRSYANGCMARVRRVFRWGVSHGLIHPDVLARLHSTREDSSCGRPVAKFRAHAPTLTDRDVGCLTIFEIEGRHLRPLLPNDRRDEDYLAMLVR